MSAEYYPTAVYHCDPCDWENVDSACDEDTQERQAKLTEDCLNATKGQHPASRILHNEILKRNPDHPMRIYQAAARCAIAIDSDGCPFFVAEQQSVGKRSVDHRDQAMPRHLKIIK